MGERSKPVTGPYGDNPITDEQIRELRNANMGSNAESTEFISMCHTALGLYEALTVDEVSAARERCAAAWNARHGAKP